MASASSGTLGSSIRTVICCHGSNYLGQAVGGLLGPLHQLDWSWSGHREDVCLRRARTVVVSSLATRDFVLGQGVSPAKIELIPLGVDVERFRPPESRRDGRPLTVGFVGRLEQVKGIDFVWRVMGLLGADSGIRFRFKGTIHPSTRAHVLRQLERFKASADYEAAGPHEAMPEFFRSLDVLLLPSRFENFGLTYAEAMATGLLVFAGPGGAGVEAVKDGVTGFLADPDGSPQPVVDRLRALAADRTAFDDIRRRARHHVVENASVDRFARAKEDQYLRIRNRLRAPEARIP